ncbi:MAG: DEAD/DEAH box helicase, partial [Synergistaceae bacterium]|nr:DEAD/DEAH box helicase [Synergistaceae bacterium]
YTHAFLDKSGYDVSVRYLMDIAKKVVYDISISPDTNITRTAPAPSPEGLLILLRSVPYAIGCEYVSVNWIERLYSDIAQMFNNEFAAFQGTAEEYFKAKNARLNVAGRVFFHLVERKDENHPFAFLATYSEGDKESVKHVPLKNALETNNNEENIQDKLIRLLSAVSRAADKSVFISELIESGELFSPLRLTPEEAYTFLLETPIYEECGVICRIPNFWKKKANARLKVNVGGKEPSVVGLDALMAFTPSIYLGDDEFTRDEIEQLLSETRGLAFLKGKWVEVNPDKLLSLLQAFDEIEGKDISLAEAIRMQSGLLPVIETKEEDYIEVTNGEWLDELKAKMINPAIIVEQRVSKSFRADLREYQTTGFNWLNLMSQSRFGALLADDMGLGKTVQVLALLDFLRKDKIKTLLIIPASLIMNWKKEAERFTPLLKVKLLHGKETDFSLVDADLFITTYGMAVRGGADLYLNVVWDLLILDEAQAIKNHGNKQTTAVKKLSARSRIAMTGTPVENRLSDLWSIFDFLNKGLLGSQKEYASFTNNLKDNTSGYEKLRNVISPFILRRLKTDKTIISDLPDKMEIKQYTTLTKKQIALYDQLVHELEHIMEDASTTGINRKGIILASIMKFKQICNHPDQYLDNREFDPKFSGKFETLSEICGTIREKRERVIVFTQFKEMTDPIARFLEKVFERKGLILHGSTAVKKRGELVEQFNSPEYVPFMVLSLKAGGVGLNLTGANHVIHFDRWWNPAIENQATDRAFRIGQQKNVCVHKFVTAGTIEEKIDVIIESKQNLASSVVTATSGEKWITEMTNEELFNLFRLGA